MAEAPPDGDSCRHRLWVKKLRAEQHARICRASAARADNMVDRKLAFLRLRIELAHRIDVAEDAERARSAWANHIRAMPLCLEFIRDSTNATIQRRGIAI